MKKTILILSLLLSLWGIIEAFSFFFFTFNDLTEFQNFIFFNTNPYYYSGLDIYIVTKRISEYSYESSSLGLINLFFYLSFLTGSFIYYFSKYKETKLLLFNYSLVFLYSITRIFTFVAFFYTDRFGFYGISYLIISLLYLFVSYYIITKKLNITKEKSADNDIQIMEDDLENASNSKRFLNLFIDSFIIIIIAFAFIDYSERNEPIRTFLSYLKTAFGDKFGLAVFFFIIKFIYYLTLESVFKTTPAKFVTACYVVDEEGNSPNFSIIFKRTLLRFVPFESFSFFLGKNLHDNYSNTYVVNNKTDRKIEDRYTQFLTVVFGVVIVIYFFMSNRHFY